MKPIYLIILLFAGFETKAQVIHGRVLESGTNKPVAKASVYFDGTFLVTASDSEGNFLLKTSLSNKVPIIVSSIGYSTATIYTYSANEPLKILLEPKTYQLKEVLIGSDGMSLKEKIKIFKQEFLGMSAIARKCEIVNMDDILLSYDQKKGILTASSDKPIIVYNKELGYKISCFLSNFTFTPFRTSYGGNQLFQEDISLKDLAENEIKKKREDSYMGSRMHFIRSLWNNDLETNNFSIYDGRNKKLDYFMLVDTIENLKYLRLRTPLRVQYKNRTTYISPLTSMEAYIYIDKNGIFDSSKITWRGEMGDQRVGDLLPFEYTMEAK